MTRRDSVVDDFFGTPVLDPYRWLEELDSPETSTWVAEQNERSSAYVAGPQRERLLTRLTELWNYPRTSVPSRRAGRTFYRRNDGLQNQAVLYVREGNEPRVLIDPNTLSDDGTVALQGTATNKDARLLAYTLARSGSDWQEIKVRSVDTGEDFSDHLLHLKFTSVAWLPDGSGFYYSRFPDPATVPAGEESFDSKVYLHRLGDAQDADTLIYERPDFRELGFDPAVTEDDQFLILHVWNGTDPRNRLYFRPLGSDEPFIRLFDEGDAAYNVIESVGNSFYLQTDKDAPKGKVVRVDLATRDWTTIIPEQDEVLDFVTIAGGKLIAGYLQDAQHQLRVYTLEGDREADVPLPGIGSIAGLSGRPDDNVVFFGFTSYLYPTTIFSFDVITGKVREELAPGITFDPSPYETTQVFVTSKDGTKVPMFLTSKRDLPRDGLNPTLLYGYGGFNVSLTPGFSPHILVWLEAGGVYAVANLRGGGEYGEAWHQAGILERKQNVFDDFAACADYLIDSGITRKEKLAIEGGSNGGLLVSAAVTQRPEAYGAVVCQVPVADMLRYHRWTIFGSTTGRYWIPEYGAPDTEEMFKVLYSYSPYHNARPANYPPIMILTADHDDRVHPANSFKLAAALQHAQQGVAPVLLRVDVKAGHGAGKPTSKVLEELADIYAFLWRTIVGEG